MLRSHEPRPFENLFLDDSPIFPEFSSSKPVIPTVRPSTIPSRFFLRIVFPRPFFFRPCKTHSHRRGKKHTLKPLLGDARKHLLWRFQSLPGGIGQLDSLFQDFASNLGIQIALLPFHEIGAKSTCGSGGAPGQHNLRDSALIDGSISSYDFFGGQFRLFTDCRSFRS